MNALTVRFRQRLGASELDINLTLPARGISAIFGRSGAGKTSIINAISGLTKPQSGRIELNGTCLFDSMQEIDLPTHKRKIGYVFQDARLFPHFSIEGNLRFGMKQDKPALFAEVVTLLALDPLLKRYPASLSGGEKQRVAIGRALLSEPALLLMDEPLASLDIPRKKEVMPFLERLADHIEIPIIYVTHSLQEILRLASHIAVVDQGKIVASGKLEEIWSSQTLKPWFSFADQSSLFLAKVAEQHASYALTRVQLAENVSIWIQKVDVCLGVEIRLQVRACDVSLTLVRPEQTSIRNVLPATITRIEKQHSSAGQASVNVELRLENDCHLWATITPWALDELQLSVGTQIFAQIKGVSVTQRDIALTH